MKKMQVPATDSPTPEFMRAVRDNLEIITGRRRNQIDVPDLQNLTFSSTPTQAQCQALNAYVNAWAQVFQQLMSRLDG